MKILVTGANGFLGRHVVNALLRSGHRVRALVRPAAGNSLSCGKGEVELFHANLLSHPDLLAAFDGVDAVVHLATRMAGDEFALFRDTVIGTERFFEAMARSPVKRLVLCSSFSVDHWLQGRGTVDEELPLSREIYSCGGYASAKLWQETMAQRMRNAHEWELTILRPGFIWGPGNECPISSIGRKFGSLFLVFGGCRRPPFTHVENCADSFRAVIENPPSVGQTFNIVDNHGVSAWRFSGEYLRRTDTRGIRVPVPYWLMRILVSLAQVGSRAIFGSRAKLPSLFVPTRFAQGYRPVEYSTERLRLVLGWRPPLDFEQCLQRTYPTQ